MDEELEARLRRAMDDAASGRTKDLGDFAQYAEDEPLDDECECRRCGAEVLPEDGT